MVVFNFAVDIALHCICLSSRCGPIDNYVAIFALYKLVAHFLAALFKNLILCRFAWEHIFKLIVSICTLEVRTSEYFKASFAIDALWHYEDTWSIILDFIVNHLIFFTLGERPHPSWDLDEDGFIFNDLRSFGGVIVPTSGLEWARIVLNADLRERFGVFHF